jgi:hypothetical protein
MILAPVVAVKNTKNVACINGSVLNRFEHDCQSFKGLAVISAERNDMNTLPCWREIC